MVNLEKLRAMYSSRVSRHIKDAFTKISGIRCVEDLGTYLGFPLCKGRVRTSMFNRILESIHTRLANLKGKLLNKAGRLCLAKSVISSILVYCMQTQLLPLKICSRIDNVTRNFIWG